MKIGKLNIPAGAGIAPMAGITDMPMRLLCFEQGAAWGVSEMLSAKGFLYAPGGTRAMDDLLRKDKDEGILGLQLFGSEPDLVGEAADQLSSVGFQFIDINMGCPMPKIVNNGEGSALMKSPVQAERVISAAVQRAHVPVTVKFRSGWDSTHINAVEIAKIAEGSGAAAVAVHARTRAQLYSGSADWQVIADVKNAVKIPVIGNGDVTSVESYKKLIEKTGCDAALIGRAARGNPWLFGEIKAFIEGREWVPPTAEERLQTALRHARLQCSFMRDTAAMREMRKHVAWYTQGMRDSAKLRLAINETETYDGLEELLEKYRKEVLHGGKEE